MTKLTLEIGSENLTEATKFFLFYFFVCFVFQKSIQHSIYNDWRNCHPFKKKEKNTIGELVLLMLYGILLDNLAWDPSVASIVFVSPRCVNSLLLYFSFLVTEGRLCFIANCSVHRSLGDIFKRNSAEVYPTETNSYLILLAMSIFVVHIYACSNTISWQWFYLCFSVVLGFDIYFTFVFGTTSWRTARALLVYRCEVRRKSSCD